MSTSTPNTDAERPLAAAGASAPASSLAALKAAARALGASGGGAGASRLLGLLCNPAIDIDSVLHCLRAEPALTARVLKVANSPFYGRSGAVGTLERAVQLLGLSAIRGIAAAGCLDRAMPGRTGPAFDPRHYRRHSLAVAVAAQALARAAGLSIDAEAFIAGLLRDIGLLLLARADPSAMARFVPPPAAEAGTVLAAEQAHFGVDHAQCAGLLVESWRLPAWLVEPLSRPRSQADEADAAAGDMGRLAPLLALADVAAARAGLGLWPGIGTTPELRADLAAAAGRLGLDARALDEVAASLAEAVDRMSGDA